MLKTNSASALKMALPAHGKQVYSARPTRSYPEMSVLSRAKKYKEGIMTKKELKAVIKALNEAMELDRFEFVEDRIKIDITCKHQDNLIHLYQLLKLPTLGAVLLLKFKDTSHEDCLSVYFL